MAHAIAIDDSEECADSVRMAFADNVLKSAYFIDPEHLNTPRLVADSTGTTVWRWDQAEPFGVNVPDENPSALGAFEFPLRFPGQYADKETNLSYNYFRDYDPSLGRYGQSDPIGLRGGINTYAYVVSSPTTSTDPNGLQTSLPGFPYPIPPVFIPGSPANQAFVNSVNQLVNRIADACRANTDDSDHRGRIQAQGGGYEDSESWAQGVPLSLVDGHVKLNALVVRMPPKEYFGRRFAIEEARTWISRAGQAGGVSARVSKSFSEPNAKRGERMDIEVHKGRAFVP